MRQTGKGNIWTPKKSITILQEAVEGSNNMGVKINHYDQFVANKWIKGKQTIITYHVEDLKISCQDPKEVLRIIRRLKKLYGKHGDLTISKEKQHKILRNGVGLQQKREGSGRHDKIHK